MQTSKILPIVGYGSPILKAVCVEAENKPETIELVESLLTTMDSIGTAVGLAAPQVNSNLRMFVMCPGGKEVVIINPTIKSKGGKYASEEGCLSIPGINGIVPDRNDVLCVEYYDVKFNKHTTWLRGFEAIVFQHELDHLNGILYTDRMTKQGREEVADKLSDLEKGIYKSPYPMIFPGTSVTAI